MRGDSLVQHGLLAVDGVLYRGRGLPEDGVAVGRELHPLPLALEPGKLPPVADGREHFPQEDGHQADGDDATGDTLEIIRF